MYNELQPIKSPYGMKLPSPLTSLNSTASISQKLAMNRYFMLQDLMKSSKSTFQGEMLCKEG
jgi:hypothetical protein